MKKRFRVVSLFMLAVMLVSTLSIFTPIVSSSAEANIIQKDLEDSLINCEQCVEFIENNFSQVIFEYNNAHEDTGLQCNATSIEGQTLILLTDFNRYGIFLDFDGSNGYMLVTEGYTLYEFEPQGDLPYLKGVTLAYYNSFDGFMYLDTETGLLEKYDYVDKTSELYGGLGTEATAEDVLYGAAGQPSDVNGDGKIYDIDSYVAAVYPNYVYQDRYIITDYQFIYQDDTSVYKRYSGGKIYTEGNCVINATYSMMNDWYRRGRFQWLPSGTTNYATLVTSDRLYSTYGTGTYNGWTTNSYYTLSHMPTLYLELRDYAIDYGYNPVNGMSSNYIIDMVERVASSRGYTFNMVKTSSFNSNVRYQLDTNHACVISVNGSSTFNNHSMGLFGYVHYTYTSGWWIFATTKDKYFYVVDDGHSYKKGDSNYSYNFIGVNTPVCYFDPNTSAKPSLSFFYLE